MLKLMLPVSLILLYFTPQQASKSILQPAIRDSNNNTDMGEEGEVGHGAIEELRGFESVTKHLKSDDGKIDELYPEVKKEPTQEGMEKDENAHDVGEDFDIATTNIEFKSGTSINITEENYQNDVSTINSSNTIEDNELEKAHIDMDINDFEDLKAKLVLLENNLRQHADFDLVQNEELVDTDNMLKEIGFQTLAPYEDTLKALKSQIVQSNSKLDDDTLVAFETVIENAEHFLRTSRQRLSEVEVLEKEWKNSEEKEIESNIEDIDESVSKDMESDAAKINEGDSGVEIVPTQKEMEKDEYAHDDGEDFDIATTNIEFKSGTSFDITEEKFQNDVSTVNSSITIEDNELAKAHIDMDINGFEDLKDKLVFLENKLRQHADFDLAENEELVDTDNMLKNIGFQILEPYEDKLKALKSQIVQSNSKLNDDTLAIIETVIENAEIFLQTSRERLSEVEVLEEEWENAEKKEIESKIENNDESDLKMVNINQDMVKGGQLLYEQLRRGKINEEHLKAHEDEADLALVSVDIKGAGDTLHTSTGISSSLHPFLTPGLTMLVFLLLCSAVAYKLTRKRRVANRLVSQAMAKDLGYTELDSVEDKQWGEVRSIRWQHKMK